MEREWFFSLDCRQSKGCIVTSFKSPVICCRYRFERNGTHLLPNSRNVRQWCVNDYWSCIMDNPRAVQWYLTHNQYNGHLSPQNC